MNLHYILITPVKNEEDHLPELIDSVVAQSVRPDFWVIVDDGSTDGSAAILNKQSSIYPWIHVIQSTKCSPYNLGKHYAQVCNLGFSYAINECDRAGIEFQYIGLSDADMIYPGGFFEELMAYCQRNEKTGLISGRIKIRMKTGREFFENNYRYQHFGAEGTGRIWRKEAFFQTGGYPDEQSPDSISNILVHSAGWQVIIHPSVFCYQLRSVSSREGIWKGYWQRGERAYYLHSTFLSVLNVIFFLIFFSRSGQTGKKSLAFIYGYLYCVVSGKPKTSLEPVKRFNRDYKRIMNEYLNLLYQLFKGLI